MFDHTIPTFLADSKPSHCATLGFPFYSKIEMSGLKITKIHLKRRTWAEMWKPLTHMFNMDNSPMLCNSEQNRLVLTQFSSNRRPEIRLFVFYKMWNVTRFSIKFKSGSWKYRDLELDSVNLRVLFKHLIHLVPSKEFLLTFITRHM